MIIKRLRIGILTSKNCTDGLAIIKAIQEGKLVAEIGVIVGGEEPISPIDIEKICREEKIPFYYLPEFLSRENERRDNYLIFMMEKYAIDLVLLIGYMRILTPVFVERYRNRIMNIHPSLLPAFAGGMDREVHQAVLDAGVKITGCTLHFVSDELDSGPIIIQKSVGVKEKDTVESLRQRVQLAEQSVLIKAIKLFQEKRIRVEGRKTIIEPKPR